MLNSRQRQMIETITKNPVIVGHQLGFELLTELHNDWIREMFSGTEDRTLQAHRGSYKTTCVAITLALFIVCKPNVKVAFFRKTDRDVKDIVNQVQKMLKTDAMIYIAEVLWGKQLFLTRANGAEISTNLTNDPRGGAQLVGLGIGGSITGKHYDMIFTDDIVNVDDRMSKAERDRTRLFYQELQNVKNRGGRIFNSGTPWHKEDAFELMPAPMKYDVYHTGLISDSEIREIRNKMLPSLFSANYELRHIASEDVIFLDPKLHADPDILLDTNVCHIDASYEGADYTAFTIINKKNGEFYVYGKIWREHVDDVSDEIIALRKKFRAGRIYCENNGDKGYLAKALRAKGEVVTTYHESMNKFIKIGTFLKFNWERVHFVEGCDTGYLEQILDYTEQADHDDAPDSLACAIRIIAPKSEIPYVSPFGN